MLDKSKFMQAYILWSWENDKEKFLRDLGGINKECRNEERIYQIEQTIESLKQGQQSPSYSTEASSIEARQIPR